MLGTGDDIRRWSGGGWWAVGLDVRPYAIPEPRSECGFGRGMHEALDKAIGQCGPRRGPGHGLRARMDAALICTAHWHRRRRKVLGYATRQSATHGSLIADAERDFPAPRSPRPSAPPPSCCSTHPSTCTHIPDSASRSRIRRVSSQQLGQSEPGPCHTYAHHPIGLSCCTRERAPAIPPPHSDAEGAMPACLARGMTAPPHRVRRCCHTRQPARTCFGREQH